MQIKAVHWRNIFIDMENKRYICDGKDFDPWGYSSLYPLRPDLSSNHPLKALLSIHRLMLLVILCTSHVLLPKYQYSVRSIQIKSPIGEKCTWPFRIYEPHSYAWRQGDWTVMLPRLVSSHVCRSSGADCPILIPVWVTNEWMNLTIAGKFVLKSLDEWKLNCVYLLYRSYITCGQSSDDDDTADTWREAGPPIP